MVTCCHRQLRPLSTVHVSGARDVLASLFGVSRQHPVISQLHAGPEGGCVPRPFARRATRITSDPPQIGLPTRLPRTCVIHRTRTAPRMTREGGQDAIHPSASHGLPRFRFTVTIDFSPSCPPAPCNPTRVRHTPFLTRQAEVHARITLYFRMNY